MSIIPPRFTSNPLSGEAADFFAATVRTFWKEKGFLVATRVERDGELEGYVVRSDLVNGLPRKALAA